MEKQDLTKSHVTIIGAGIIGICCACQLQRKGFSVTVIDRVPPGESCSWGNNGNISSRAVVPFSLPGMAWKAPRWVMEKYGPLAIKWSYLPRALPWLIRFAQAGSLNKVLAISDDMASIYRKALQATTELLKATGTEDVVRHEGLLTVYQDEAGLRNDKLSWDLKKKHGVPVTKITRQEIQEMEPALAHIFDIGMYNPEACYAVDPFKVVNRLANFFVRQGGIILQREVTGFDMRPEGPVAIFTDQGTFEINNLVISAGAWSHKLSAQLGNQVPLESHRGYHTTLPDSGIELKTPIIWADHHFSATPMEVGLRFAGTVEFAGLDAPPNFSNVQNLLDLGQRVFPNLNCKNFTKWMGHRPATPDTLPVIGRSPHFPKVYYAFGHGQLGLTGGAVTGRLLSEIVAGEPTSIDAYPFRIDRF
jgi:D-amino-acid dehydrogenase